eukprot:COSAG01_NODE_5584_length_4164_cov_5.739483_2_plen_779_part_00
MSGDPWPDLEQKIESGEVPGSWPTARDKWGSCAEKMQILLVYQLPSLKDPHRFVPGRPHAYIVPASSLTPADEHGDTYLSNTQLKACFVIRPPANPTTLENMLASPVLGAPQVYLSECTPHLHCALVTPVVSDNLERIVTTGDEDEDQVDAKLNVLKCIARLLEPSHVSLTPLEQAQLMHRKLEQQNHEQNKQKVWEDCVARYTLKEMEATVFNVDRQLYKLYTLAHYFTTSAEAKTICAPGGHIQPKDHDKLGSGVLVCLTSPAALGWQANAGGRFKAQVHRLLGRLEDFDTMLMLGVPTAALRGVSKGAFIIPSEFCCKDDGYSNCHVVKWYTIERGRKELERTYRKVSALERLSTAPRRQCRTRDTMLQMQDISEVVEQHDTLSTGKERKVAVVEQLVGEAQQLESAQVELRPAVMATAADARDDTTRVQTSHSDTPLEDEKAKAKAVTRALEDEKAKAKAVARGNAIYINAKQLRAVTAELEDEKAKAAAITRALEDEKAKAAAVTRALDDEKAKAAAVTEDLDGLLTSYQRLEVLVRLRQGKAAVAELERTYREVSALRKRCATRDTVLQTQGKSEVVVSGAIADSIAQESKSQAKAALRQRLKTQRKQSNNELTAKMAETHEQFDAALAAIKGKHLPRTKSTLKLKAQLIADHDTDTLKLQRELSACRKDSHAAVDKRLAAKKAEMAWQAKPLKENTAIVVAAKAPRVKKEEVEQAEKLIVNLERQAEAEGAERKALVLDLEQEVESTSIQAVDTGIGEYCNKIIVLVIIAV